MTYKSDTTKEERLNKGREMIQSFIDDLVPGDDKKKGEYAKRLWDIHDQGYHAALADNGMAYDGN